MEKLFEDCVQESCGNCDALSFYDQFTYCLVLKACKNLDIDSAPIMKEVSRLRWEIEKNIKR